MVEPLIRALEQFTRTTLAPSRRRRRRRHSASSQWLVIAGEGSNGGAKVNISLVSV